MSLDNRLIMSTLIPLYGEKKTKMSTLNIRNVAKEIKYSMISKKK